MQTEDVEHKEASSQTILLTFNNGESQTNKVFVIAEGEDHFDVLKYLMGNFLKTKNS